MDRVIELGIMDILFGHPTEKDKALLKPTIKGKIVGLLCLQRPLVAFMGVVLSGVGVVFALGGIPSLFEILVGGVAAYSLTVSIHILNDIVDSERDKKKWATRPLPSGLIKRSHAVAYFIIMVAIGLYIAYTFFNWQTAAVGAITLLLGGIYTAFLRDRVGYMTLPWIPALIVIGGWAAFSPSDILSNCIPWLLYFLFVLWQSFHIVLEEPYGLVPTKAFGVILKPREAVWVSIFLSILTLALGVMIYFLVSLHWIYLVLITGNSLMFWVSVIPLAKEPTSPRYAMKSFQVATIYNIVLCLALMLAILI
ncbi:MAG: UbiA family prenyltransferase [Promethearchaeota archaeon]